jgi:UDP-glucose 4-epimerase
MDKGKCLVIGANGFIGSHLVDELAGAGYSVRAVDIYSTPPQFNNSSLVEVVKADFFSDQEMADVLQGCEYIFHLFSATTPFTADNDPYADINKNLLRNVQFFDLITKFPHIKKVVFVSSGGAVYGHLAEAKKVTEQDAPLPVSPYGIGKLATEYYLAYFKQKFGLNYIVYRLTNPYGPRQRANNNQGVIPIFLQKIHNDEELTIYGDGTSSRDFLYIRDATRMMVESFDKQTKHTTYNVGSGRQIDLNTIVKAIAEVSGKKPNVKYLDAPKTFLTKTMVSVERFDQEFSVESHVKLEDGLRLMLNS